MVEGWTRRYAESSLTVITRGKLYLGSATILSPLRVTESPCLPLSARVDAFFFLIKINSLCRRVLTTSSVAKNAIAGQEGETLLSTILSLKASYALPINLHDIQ